MLHLYVRTRTWLTRGVAARTRDDQGSVTVEQVIITGMVAGAAVLAGTALLTLVNSGIGRWSLW